MSNERPDPTTSAEAAERFAEVARQTGAEATVSGNVVTLRWGDGPWLSMTVNLIPPPPPPDAPTDPYLWESGT